MSQFVYEHLAKSGPVPISEFPPVLFAFGVNG